MCLRFMPNRAVYFGFNSNSIDLFILCEEKIKPFVIFCAAFIISIAICICFVSFFHLKLNEDNRKIHKVRLSTPLFNTGVRMFESLIFSKWNFGFCPRMCFANENKTCRTPTIYNKFIGSVFI